MRIFSLFLSSAILTFTLALTAFAQVEISKDAKQDPTLLFRGINGNTALSEQVKSDLLNCGWFNVIASGPADLILSGSASGNLLKLDISNGAGVVMKTFSVSGPDTDKTAHTAVDAVLKELFGIPGICRTKIVFAAETAPGRKEIYVCDFDGRNIMPLTRNNTLCIDPIWHPGGKTVIYSYFGPSYTHLIELDLASGKSRRLTQYPGINAGGAISPDGRYLALILGMNNQVDLYIRETNGSQLTRITNDKAVEASPCWSPDGRKLCFVSDKSGRPRLYIVSPFERKAPVMLTATIGSERVAPSWSKDNRIAYSARLGGAYTVAVVDLNGDRPADSKVGLPETAAIAGEGPSWAPDNRHVVVSDRGVIYIVDTRLGKVRRLVAGTTKVSGPDWSPLLY